MVSLICCDCAAVSCSSKKYFLTDDNKLVSNVKCTYSGGGRLDVMIVFYSIHSILEHVIMYALF